MKKWIRLVIFLLAFQMEIRVRASGSLIEQPSSCLKSKETCSVQVKADGINLAQDSVDLHASGGSVFVRVSDRLWRFVKGTVWVEKGAGVEIETLYGNIIAFQGQYWILEKDSKIIIRNMDAELQVTLRDGKKLNVPEGFEFWISGLNSKGQSEFGMIQPVDMKDHLPLWHSMYKGSKKDFLNEVRHLRENWGDLVGKSSSLYKNAALRELASLREKDEVQRQYKERLELQRHRMQKLYYERVFER